MVSSVSDTTAADYKFLATLHEGTYFGTFPAPPHGVVALLLWNMELQHSHMIRQHDGTWCGACCCPIRCDAHHQESWQAWAQCAVLVWLSDRTVPSSCPCPWRTCVCCGGGLSSNRCARSCVVAVRSGSPHQLTWRGCAASMFGLCRCCATPLCTASQASGGRDGGEDQRDTHPETSMLTSSWVRHGDVRPRTQGASCVHVCVLWACVCLVCVSL